MILDVLTALLAFGAGWALWTLGEYVLHRFADKQHALGDPDLLGLLQGAERSVPHGRGDSVVGHGVSEVVVEVVAAQPGAVATGGRT